MTTQELIDNVNSAQTKVDSATTDFQNATTAAQAASDALNAAKSLLTDAKQALHDDLSENGAYATVDSSTTPVTVLLYTAADPDSFLATPIRTG